MGTSDDPGNGRRRRRNRPAREPADDPARRSRGGRDRSRAGEGRAERGLRNLVGPGPSQLGVEGALRARDVNRPTDEDLAEAEREVQIVRRHWRPPS